MIATHWIDCDHPFAAAVTRWVYDEWGVKEGRTFEATANRLFDHSNSSQTHVATDGVEPLGVISFTRFNYPEHREPSLWIDALFVAPHRRGLGIGSGLVAFAEKLAIPFADRLYVYTEFPDFYRQFGWTEIKPRNEANGAVLERVLPAACATPPTFARQ